MVVWAGGVTVDGTLAASLPTPHGRGGRVALEPDLSVAGHPEVFVVGRRRRRAVGTDPVRSLPPGRPGGHPVRHATPRARSLRQLVGPAHRSRSPTTTRASWPPSGATPRSPSCDTAPSCGGRWAGWRGWACTSSTWWASATGSVVLVNWCVALPGLALGAPAHRRRRRRRALRERARRGRCRCRWGYGGRRGEACRGRAGRQR